MLSFGIQQAQVRLITAANAANVVSHYWKMAYYILYHQQLQDWGSNHQTVGKRLSAEFPEKKGYQTQPYLYVSVCKNISIESIAEFH